MDKILKVDYFFVLGNLY